MTRCENCKTKYYGNSLARHISSRLFINIKGGARNDLRRVCRGWLPEQSLERRTRINARMDFRREGCRITPIPIFNMEGKWSIFLIY